MVDKSKWIGGFFQLLTAIACLIIVAMVAIILGNIVIHGVGEAEYFRPFSEHSPL